MRKQEPIFIAVVFSDGAKKKKKTNEQGRGNRWTFGRLRIRYKIPRD